MPKEATVTKARRLAREGRKPATQAGEFIREEMHKLKEGSGSIRSRKQAAAVGLSEARRAGVPLQTPKKGAAPASTHRKAKRDEAIGSGKARPSPNRSRGVKKAARTRERNYSRGAR